MNEDPTDWDGLVEVPDSEEPTDDEEWDLVSCNFTS